MGTIRNRVERLESQMIGQSKRETQQERLEREAAERAKAANQKYWDGIQGLFDSLEDAHKEIVYADFYGAAWKDLDFRGRGEFGIDNGFALLSNAVLSLGAYNVSERKIPHPTLPDELCQWFAEQPANLFQRPENPFRNEETTRRYFQTRWQWLDGAVACQSCWLPLPCCGGYHEQVPEWIAGGDSLGNLPFKKCPACAGPVAWNCHRK
jgi:hypothetical protein